MHVHVLRDTYYVPCQQLFATLCMLHLITQLDGGEADFREPAKTTTALRHVY